jgi:hypothetical protein
VDGALNWVTEYHERVSSEFQAQSLALPSWGPTIDPKVKTYVERLGYFIRGADCWSFEAERCFGIKGREIQRKKVVDLLPKAEAATPMMASCGRGRYLNFLCNIRCCLQPHFTRLHHMAMIRHPQDRSFYFGCQGGRFFCRAGDPGLVFNRLSRR